MSSKFVVSAFDTKNRPALLQLAHIAESAERYEDMCKIVKALVDLVHGTESELTVEERNLLSVAYKNVVGSRRAAWRTLNADEHKDQADVQKYRKVLEEELKEVCNDVLALLDNILKKNKGHESQVFYLKMAGDYNRYLAEILPSEAVFAQGAGDKYENALKIATDHLAPTNPIRLGLALNYSVYLYEIQKQNSKACETAKKAFDEAIAKLDQLDEASYKDSTLIMQLLRDNLTLWTSDANNDN